MAPMIPDHATCYQAVLSRDQRFDGTFYSAVATTGIYCRPSCPARTPAAANVAFFPTAAAAQAAGFRACKRCLPDATPGSPDWDVAAAAAGRAMRLIADGVVEREGVAGLAGRVGYTPRHLTRLLTRELGAGPLALARARRAQLARTLIGSTGLTFGDIAFAAGFASVRQFNDTIREVYGATPTQLRGTRARRTAATRRATAGSTPGRWVPAGEAETVPASPSLRRPGTDPAVPPGRAPTTDSGAAAGRRPGVPAAAAIAADHEWPAGSTGTIRLRLAVRTPFHGSALLWFLAPRAIPGVETVGDGWYARTLDLPHAPGVIRLELPDLPEPGTTGTVVADLRLGDLRDIGAAVERARRLLDADCDPVAVAARLGGDPLLGPLVTRWPGLRIPGHMDGAELAVRAIVGQQISVAGARTVLGRLVQRAGLSCGQLSSGLTHLFPEPAALAVLDPADLPMPRARGRALIGLAAALADGELALDRGPDRTDTYTRLLALGGIGEWTASYVAIRALGDPDAFMPTDLGTRHALAALGEDPRTAAKLAQRWRPWRSYAQSYLWTALLDPRGGTHVDNY